MREHRLEAVVDRLYEAAVEPSLWRDVLLETSEVLGAEGTVFFAYPSSSIGAVCSEGLDELRHRFLTEGWHLNNPRVSRVLLKKRLQKVTTELELFTPEELDRHPFNAELINKLGFRWVAVAVLGEVNGSSLVFAADRRARDERFGSLEIAAIEWLIPHLVRATQITARMAIARADGMLDAFERLDCAALLLDVLGRAVRLNHKAGVLVGREIAIIAGQVMATNPAADGALRRVVASALSGRHSAVRSQDWVASLPRPAGRPLVVYAIPIVGAANDVFQRAKVLLTFVDPDEHRVPAEIVLRQSFGLTPAEMRLAAALAQGRDLKAIADEHGVSLATARGQLKTLMGKTNTHRQAELVSLLGRLALVPQ